VLVAVEPNFVRDALHEVHRPLAVQNLNVVEHLAPAARDDDRAIAAADVAAEHERPARNRSTLRSIALQTMSRGMNC
jgi:hypothetical protein